MHTRSPCGLSLPVPEEDCVCVITPVLAFLARFLPARATLSLDAWQGDDTAAQITLHVISTPSCVPCPRCPVRTSRVHSQSTRTVADLAWGAYAVRWQLRMRQFFCDHSACPRQIFTERSPTVVARGRDGPCAAPSS